MAGSKSAYFERMLLDIALSQQSYTPATTIYVALSTAYFTPAATGTSMNEVSTSGTGYMRTGLTANYTNWPAASGSNPATKSNGMAITFPTATSSWGTILSAYLVDASTNGNVLYGADLSASKTILTGDTATYAVGAIVLTEY